MSVTTLLYWEDLQPGFSLDLGSYYLSQDELISFAQQYDPQVFHVDPEQAKQSPLGCLCASGLQTTAITQKLTVAELFSKTKLVAGLGVDKLRYYKPVLPNESLSASMTVKKAYRTPKAKDRGIVVYDVVVTNPREEKVSSMQATIMVMCAPTDT
ncbi:MAG: acyl dehydratase [Cellvibrionaceae bacterium]|nr:acyl dehydratase [Cellvibrionaceae bacterium]